MATPLYTNESVYENERKRRRLGITVERPAPASAMHANEIEEPTVEQLLGEARGALGRTQVTSERLNRAAEMAQPLSFEEQEEPSVFDSPAERLIRRLAAFGRGKRPIAIAHNVVEASGLPAGARVLTGGPKRAMEQPGATVLDILAALPATSMAVRGVRRAMIPRVVGRGYSPSTLGAPRTGSTATPVSHLPQVSDVENYYAMQEQGMPAKQAIKEISRTAKRGAGKVRSALERLRQAGERGRHARAERENIARQGANFGEPIMPRPETMPTELRSPADRDEFLESLRQILRERAEGVDIPLPASPSTAQLRAKERFGRIFLRE